VGVRFLSTKDAGGATQPVLALKPGLEAQRVERERGVALPHLCPSLARTA